MDIIFRILEFSLISFLLIYSAYKTWDRSKSFAMLQSIIWRTLFFFFMIYNLFKGRYILIAILDMVKSLSE